MSENTPLTFSKKPFKDVDHIINKDGLYLRKKVWKVKNPKFLMLINHGFGSHCDRFDETAEKLNEIGGHVFCHDLAGFGESQGQRAIVDDYKKYVRDTLQLFDEEQQKFSDLPAFVMGQSMGGAMSLVIASDREKKVNGAILLAGMMGPVVNKIQRVFLPLLSFTMPNFVLKTMADDSEVKFDENGKEFTVNVNDPLKVRMLKSQMVLELNKLGEHCESLRRKFRTPFLAIHGKKDTVVDISVSRNLYEQSPSSDKTLKIFDDFEHNLISENKRSDMFEVIADWIQSRI